MNNQLKLLAKEKIEEVKEKAIKIPKDKKPNQIINEDFILRDNLREWIFIEDDKGNRYRERIWDMIEKIGVENWFKLKKYPLNPESIWKNRYTGSITTLKEESDLFLLWENYLPIKIWKERDLFKEYKKGTKEYYLKLQREAEENKKYKRINKNQQTLF